MATTIKLIILAKDILESDYSWFKDCAITRALHRANYNDWYDSGVEIENLSGSKILINDDNKTYSLLSRKVLKMYRSKKPNYKDSILIQDFEYTLIF